MDVKRRGSQRSAQNQSVEFDTTNNGNVARERFEIEEMRAVRQEQDAHIARLEQDNAHLTAAVENLELALCRLQIQIKRDPKVGPSEHQQRHTMTTSEESVEVVKGEDAGEYARTKAESEGQGWSDADAEIVTMKEHMHCTADTCWRQKYTESLSQLRAVLVELRNELEQRTLPDEQTPSGESRRQTKVHLIEESIRTLDVGETDAATTQRPQTGSRKRGFLGLDSSLRRVKQLRTSDSDTSLTKTPLLRKMMNLFKKKPASSSTKFPVTKK